MLRLLFISSILLSTAAGAQTPQPQASPDVLALQAKLMNELSAGLQCSTHLIALQQREVALSAELVKAKSRINELEGKNK